MIGRLLCHRCNQPIGRLADAMVSWFYDPLRSHRGALEIRHQAWASPLGVGGCNRKRSEQSRNMVLMDRRLEDCGDVPWADEWMPPHGGAAPLAILISALDCFPYVTEAEDAKSELLSGWCLTEDDDDDDGEVSP